MGMSSKWCWKDKRRVHGAFNTREDAIASAEQYGSGIVTIGQYKGKVDPGDYIPWELNQCLEIMNENALLTDYEWIEEDVFSILTEDYYDAECELGEVMRAWARKWVKALPHAFEAVEEYEVKR